VDIGNSTKAVRADQHLAEDIDRNRYDAIVVACFSVHSLRFHSLDFSYSPVTTDIFKASILASMSLLSAGETWGIVTTGKFWEKHLSDGVRAFLGQGQDAENSKFAGVYTTGLNAGDFHHVPAEVVQKRLKDATKKLLESSNVRCVVMGCAGMAGLEDIIRSTAKEVYGPDRAANLYVLDAVQAGVLQAESAVRSERTFRSG
jgi:Asp/Glu/hydantoin racemase